MIINNIVTRSMKKNNLIESDDDSDKSFIVDDNYETESITDSESEIIDEEEIEFLKNNTININLDKLGLSKEDKLYFCSLSNESQQKIIDIKSNLDNKLEDNKPIFFKILDLNVSYELKNNLLQKYEDLKKLEVSSTEYYKLQSYIKGIMRIPFGINSSIKTDNNSNYISKSKSILDETIFGHNDVKLHILQILAHYLINPNGMGNVFGIYGPMGIGKTTIIKDGLSRLFNRQFNFI